MTPPHAELTVTSQQRPRHRGPPLHQIYALPAPIRTFPLPSFYPNNPISLIHLVYAWAKQALSPPPAEPSVLHTGIWDPDSRSVHVTDLVAVRALWEQGFYGKGNLSRSEPNWLKREQIRRGAVEGDVSEQRTALRREERRQVKWERARTEQEALERTRREEAQLSVIFGNEANASSVSQVSRVSQAKPEFPASKSEHCATSDEVSLSQLSAMEAESGPPFGATEGQIEEATVTNSKTGDELAASLDGVAKEPYAAGTLPDQLSTFPNSVIDLATQPVPRHQVFPAVISETPVLSKAPVGPLELLALPNSAGETQLRSSVVAEVQSGVLEKATTVEITPTVSTLEQDRSSHQDSQWRSPVSPSDLLALPNSLLLKQGGLPKPSGLSGLTVNGVSRVKKLEAPSDVSGESSVPKSPVGPIELLALPNSQPPLPRLSPTPLSSSTSLVVDRIPDVSEPDSRLANGSSHLNGHSSGPIFGTISKGRMLYEIPGAKHTRTTIDATDEQPFKRRKSVRFSTTVESTSFLHGDPPSPDRSSVVAECNGPSTVEIMCTLDEAVLLPVEASAPGEKQKDRVSGSRVSSRTDSSPIVPAIIDNKEHLQLSAEEAFFLAYGIGALSIVDPDTRLPIPRQKLLGIFRSHSYFPPRQELQPSDPFLVHYVVYHHFRSLGWVPRHGIKFGVDWMLYTRGPVFDHAEFGLIVMPSYSHTWWKENGTEAPRKSWHWLHSVNRVLSHVLKSLVLVYVDIPPPHVFDAAMAAGGISAALKHYKVREFMVRRWSSNRNR